MKKLFKNEQIILEWNMEIDEMLNNALNQLNNDQKTTFESSILFLNKEELYKKDHKDFEAYSRKS